MNRLLKKWIMQVLNFKNPLHVIIVATIILVAVLSVGFVVKRLLNNIELPDTDSVLSISMIQYNQFVPNEEITITDKGEITQMLNAISSATKTLKQSVNDIPHVGDYLRVSLNHSEGERASITLFLYTDGEDYIEQPYVGIYRPKNRITYLYSVYAAYTEGILEFTEPLAEVQYRELPSEWFADIVGRDMTLDDVQGFIEKGENLTFEDFLIFNGKNAAEIDMYDKYTMIFSIQGGYELVVRASSPETLDVVAFSHEDSAAGIELRMVDLERLNAYIQETANLTE